MGFSNTHMTRSESLPTDYESALRELEQVLTALENGQLPLEQSLQAYHRGTQLLSYCQAQLAEAEQRVKILEGDVLKDFKPNDPER